MRGDRPATAYLAATGHEFTPHARGSTLASLRVVGLGVVYPACAGIDPDRHDEHKGWWGLPRMRGDRPPFCAYVFRCGKFTPHARGSTAYRSNDFCHIQVYPACAGIDLPAKFCVKLPYSLPRMRGDRPYMVFYTRPNPLFTPHARGSTVHVVWIEAGSVVYPACAGIDLMCWRPSQGHPSLPRMREDRPFF